MMLDPEIKFLCKKTKNSRVVLYLLSSFLWLLTSNFGAHPHLALCQFLGQVLSWYLEGLKDRTTIL